MVPSIRNALTIKSTANSLQSKPLSHQTGAWVAVYRQSFPAISSSNTSSSNNHKHKQHQQPTEDPLPPDLRAPPLDDYDAPYVDSASSSKKVVVVALKHRGGGNNQVTTMPPS